MKVSITGKGENALLKRTELTFKVEDVKVPPARKELREKIAALENVKPEHVIISKIAHFFGSRKAEGEAHIYASVEQLEKTELPYMIGRNKGVKKKKGEGVKTAAKPETKEKKDAPKEKKEGEQ